MPELLLKSKSSVLLLIFLVASFGFFIRFDNISHWLENKDRYFSPTNNTPLPLNLDSYYYLDIAKDALQGTIEKNDYQRQAPQYFARPVSLPLLSLTLALASKISGKPVEWIALLLPPFLAVLLAIPVYFLSVFLFRTSCFASGETTLSSAKTAGLISALFVLISPIYVERSSLGWCDTDILNVALLCSLTCLALYAAAAMNFRELLPCIISFTLITAFFTQWWDQAQIPVAAFALGYFLLAALFNAASRRGNRTVILVSCLGLFLVLLGLLGKPFLQSPGILLSYFKYISSTDVAASNFRFAGQLSAEQQDTSLQIMAENIAGGEGIFYLSAAGIVLLALISRKYFLFLLPWLLLLLLSAKSHRLMIFPAVIFGLGIGTIAFVACHYLRSIKGTILLVTLLAGVLAWVPVKKSQSYSSKTPPVLPLLVDQFKVIAQQIPADALIWASWGHGHSLVYHTNARTIGDGIFHPPELVYTQYLPYAVNSFRLAANWISFYSVHGLDGLKKANNLFAGSNEAWSKAMPVLQELLGGGMEKSRVLLLQRYTFPPQATEEILAFLFPQSQRPVFILLDYVTYDEQWFQWGRASFYPAESKFTYTMLPIYSPYQAGNSIRGKSDLGNVSFDLMTGAALIENADTLALKQVRIDNGSSPFIRRYKTPPPGPAPFLTLLLNQNRHITHGALVDEEVLGSVFTRMLFLKEYDASYFTPVISESPVIMVYRVQGDQYRDPVE